MFFRRYHLLGGRTSEKETLGKAEAEGKQWELPFRFMEGVELSLLSISSSTASFT